MRYAQAMSTSSFPADETLAVIQLSDPAANSSASIVPARGAIVSSLRIAGRELLYLDATTLIDPSKNVRGGIPVLFPSPGKLDDDRFSRDDHQGAMKQHGFARTLPWTIEERRNNSLTLSLTSSPETLGQFPWAFNAQLVFQLAASHLRITTRVHNKSAEPMPYALGFHPYFFVADKTGAKIDSRATRAFDNVTKQTGPFTGFHLTAKEVDLHLIDHPDHTMTLQLGDGTRIVVRGSNDFSRWIVWTVAGKEFVCVEPWTAPGNALNTGESLLTLAPNKSHESRIEIALAA
jgi:galactose mutarotase-like enzyme